MFRWTDRFWRREPSGAKASDALSFVLTLALGDTGRSGSDLARAAILLDSMVKHVPHEQIGELLVITRPQDVDEVRDRLEPYRKRLRLRVLNESALCPELSLDPKTLNEWPKPNNGWHRQQILKMAASGWVNTPFYVTLDSDVIFTKPFYTTEFLHGGKSLVGVERRTDYERLYEADFAAKESGLKELRYGGAERFLKLKRKHPGSWYSETPVILSKSLVASLLAHLETTYSKPWRQALLADLYWTEYTLYFTYAEATGLLENFHQTGDCDSVMNFSQSLWWGPDAYRDHRNLESWAIDEVFSPASRGCCVVVQSHIGYDAQAVRSRIDRFVPPAVTA